MQNDFIIALAWPEGMVSAAGAWYDSLFARNALVIATVILLSSNDTTVPFRLMTFIWPGAVIAILGSVVDLTSGMLVDLSFPSVSFDSVCIFTPGMYFFELNL